MNIAIESILLGASVLLLISIITSRAFAKLGVPSLLLFLAIGMLAGSDGPGGIYFDDPWLAQSLGVVALVFILFAGGLDTNWASIRPVLGQGLALSTFGVFITALLVGIFATLVLGLSQLEGLLLGAIVSSTDAAAVFSVLRSKKITLKGHLKPLLELESGSNDPMAVFLTIGLIHLLQKPTAGMFTLVPMFIQQMAVGAVAGYAMGKVIVLILNRIRLEYDGLYPVLTLSLVLLTYGGTAWIGGNGFLAIYLAGLVMGNSNFIHKRSLLHFHDGLAWLMQIAMFLTLGLLVFPSRLVPVMGSSLLVAAFLMLVARPISVMASLSISKIRWPEKIMVSWVGLRGAVPIILATFPLLAGLPKAETIFNIVFFIVITSVLLQGASIPLVARWLKVDAPMIRKPQPPLEFAPSCDLKSELVEIRIPQHSQVVGKQILELGLPQGALIVLVSKADECFTPNGGTILEAGDQLLMLADKDSMAKIRTLLESKGT
jgi:cell volume regulation protein A